MIYFDFSATTPADPQVLRAFVGAAEIYGNYNSAHGMGREARAQIEAASHPIQELLHAEDFEVIYTSGASESNNLAIKGYCRSFGKGHIITTRFEHASVMAPIGELQRCGFSVDFVDVTSDGRIDLASLRRLIREDTRLFIMALVSSELGYEQSLTQIREVLRDYPQVKLHVDATQAVGKIEFDPASADFLSLSAHKFYGVKGVGLLLKRKELKLQKQIGGGHSVSIDRSGTPSGELIVSLAEALRLADAEKIARRQRVEKLYNTLMDGIDTVPGLVLNNPGSVPHIVNLSLPGHAATDTQRYLDEQQICVSTGSACSDNTYSPAILTFTGSMERAASSIRISLSHLNTEHEIDILVQKLREWVSID